MLCENLDISDKGETKMVKRKVQDYQYCLSNIPLVSRNCLDLKRLGHYVSGVYTITPYDCCHWIHAQVYCDMTTDGGGWTVIQRRDKYPRQENFYRPWLEYVHGFGNLLQEFWAGLDLIHALTSQTSNEVRFELADRDGNTKFAHYKSFSVADGNDKYKLGVSGYSGTAGDSMTYNNGKKFSTFDQKNNIGKSTNCAKT